MRPQAVPWKLYMDEYDPSIHGSIRNYCSVLGLNYRTYLTRTCEIRKKTDIPPETKKDPVFTGENAFWRVDVV